MCGPATRSPLRRRWPADRTRCARCDTGPADPDRQISFISILENMEIKPAEAPAQAGRAEFQRAREGVGELGHRAGVPGLLGTRGLRLLRCVTAAGLTAA